jgi:TRAP-type uncharacterized transport system substrate-binding protein
MNIQQREQLSRRALVIGAVIIATITAAGIWLAFSLLHPTPPHSVTMAIDPEGSFTAELGKRYRELLAQSGIELKLVSTAGAVDSMARLRDPKSDISVAIVPAGISDPRQSPGLVSLGSLYYEPIWLFYRGKVLEKPEQLRGLRISIGPEGSAGRALSLEFLERAGELHQETATWLPLPPSEAAAKLLSGEIDAAFRVDAWETPAVRELLRAKELNLWNYRRADALIDLYPYLSKVVLPAGVVDLANDRPPSDIVLIALKASLVVRRDLHPAIQYLLLDAASRIHSGPGGFHPAGQFPAPESIDLPLSTHAQQYYKTGPSLVQRYLPFWLGVMIHQFLVLLIPVLGVLYPLLRGLPSLITWIESRRVYKLYYELQLLEQELATASSGEAGKDFIERLNRMEDRVSDLWVRPSLRPQLYNLRLHIGMVREEAKK